MSKRTRQFGRWIVGGAGALAAAAAMTRGMCADSSDALLDALIKKGVLTEKEAQGIKAENTTNITAMAASKWKLSDSIKNIGLFGDVRFRYEYRVVDNPDNPGIVPLAKGDTYRRERFRYALRVGLRGDLLDDFNYGIRLETSSNARSTWVTFADDTSPTPSAKSSDGIGLGQVYLGWHPVDGFEMTVGKMPMPLYTTPMVWDTDLNPEGAFEKFKYSIQNVDMFAAFGQFIYQDANPDTAAPSSDTWMLAWQLGANVKLPKDMSFKIAPVLYNYAGRGATNAANGLNLPFVGEGSGGLNPGVGGFPNNAALNQNGINDLLVLEIPAEFNFKILSGPLGTYQAKVFGDFGYNLNGAERARKAFQASQFISPPGVPLAHAYTDQDKAYMIGFGIGPAGAAAAKKHGWDARVYWQHVEQYALDVNLIDSDIFEGRGNLQGICGAFAYNFTDAIVGTVRYACANRINDNLGTGGNNPDLPGINPIKNYNLVQLDLSWRF